MRTLLRTVLPLLLAATSACAGNTAGAGDTEGGTRLIVENRSSLDLDIYARSQGSQAPRVGFAPASETTTFQLVPGMLIGARAVTFEARPAGERGQAVLSEPYNITPGDEITWSIPPQ
ncbi:MAG: hypothetical protein H0T68_04665 [Gemmatimonadales bacterium]|nr:hypothetical protein [Gemmatimonadales bacterium]